MPFPPPVTPRVLRSPVRVPKQRRSLELLNRIERAGRALIADKGYEAVSIADLADHANISVGLFYTRFRSKEHLLVHLARDYVLTLADEVDREFAAMPGSSISALAQGYFALTAALFEKHHAIFRPVSLIARQSTDPELRAIVRSFNELIHGRIRERILERRTEIVHPDPVAAVNFAILAGSSTMREALLYREPVSRLSRHRAQVARECARAFTAYLTGRLPHTPSSRDRAFTRHAKRERPA